MKVAKAVASVLVLLSMVVAARPVRGEIVDRIVAVVNQSLLGSPAAAGEIITWSAAYEEACYQAFQEGAEPPQWSPAASGNSPQLHEVVAKMIDQLLLEQALNHSPFAPSGDEDVSERIQEIADRYPDAQTFTSELKRYHLTETTLAERLRRESLTMAFVDSTLRLDVRVTTEQVGSYYETVLIPQLQSNARGAGPAANIPPLDEVREQIQEILTQQEIDLRLELWLQQLRRNAKVGLPHQ